MTRVLVVSRQPGTRTALRAVRWPSVVMRQPSGRSVGTPKRPAQGWFTRVGRRAIRETEVRVHKCIPGNHKNRIRVELMADQTEKGSALRQGAGRTTVSSSKENEQRAGRCMLSFTYKWSGTVSCKQEHRGPLCLKSLLRYPTTCYSFNEKVGGSAWVLIKHIQCSKQ